MSLTTHPAPRGGTFQFWHGAQKWDGCPEIRPSRAKSYEHGPGIYLTNALDRAKSYARGAGCLVEVDLAAETRWLEGHRMPLSVMKEFLTQAPGLRHRREIVDHLNRVAERQGQESVLTSSLVNLCVNFDALTGKHGPALAKWLTAHGVDASHAEHGHESWVVVFNPSVIVATRIHRVATVDAQADFDAWKAQIERLQRRPNPSAAVETEEEPSARRRRRSP